jgi:uncharacterized membrane protein
MSGFEPPLHPALVHLPMAATLFLPGVLALARRNRSPWLRAGLILATLGVFGGLATMVSGYVLARTLGGIEPGALLAQPLRPEPAFTALLRHHQLLAGAGLGFGIACLGCLGLARTGRTRALAAALVLSLAWLGLWGAAGHWGGRMVYRDQPGDTP